MTQDRIRRASSAPPSPGWAGLFEPGRRWAAAFSCLLLVAGLVGCGGGDAENRNGAGPRAGEPDILGFVVVEADGNEPPLLCDPFEVTNAEFETFLRSTGYRWSSGDPRHWDLATGRLLDRGLGEHPVVRVTLLDARAYAAWAGKRVPTLREWVRAANHRNRAEYPWGPTPPEPFTTNTLESRLDSTAPVGAFPEGRSETHCYDLAGNVWEWTETVPDLWSEDAPLTRRTAVLYAWLPALLPALDTEVRQARFEFDTSDSDPIWFPDLLPGLDSKPERSAALAPRIPAAYAGEGRLVVGGGFRNRIKSNLRHGDTRGEIAFEELEGTAGTVRLLALGEWRDDTGFRCVRDIGADEVEAFLVALAAARPDRRQRIADMVVAMGGAVVLPVLNRERPGPDPELAPWIRRIRAELEP